MDSLFRVEVISKTPNPQQTIYAAMHQEILLSNSDKKMIVDPADYVWAKDYTWYLNSFGYVGRTVYCPSAKKSSSLLIHQEMLKRGVFGNLPSYRVVVDHRNNDRTDNRRCNLRLASQSQNMANRKKTKINTSGYKGVRLHKPSGKWQAYIKVNYKQKSLGLFENKADAAKAYDKNAIKLFGEYANLNF